jgi:hypothetical protein
MHLKLRNFIKLLPMLCSYIPTYLEGKKIQKFDFCIEP